MEGVDGVLLRIEPPDDVRDNMHHVAVALDYEALGHLDRADLGHAADVVAAKVQQHEVLGPLFRVGKQRLGQRLVLLRCCAAARRAGNRPDRHLSATDADQDLRARADQREVAEVEVVQKGRGVGPP